MKITLVGYPLKDKVWTSVLTEQLLKLKDFEFEIVEDVKDIKGDNDIIYYLHTDFYAKDRIRENVKQIVLFNHPLPNWGHCLRNATLCLFQSKRYFEQYRNNRSKLLGMGIDLDLFKPAMKIGVVAWKQERKNAQLLKDIINSTPDFEFHICGIGWDGEFEKFKNVINHGWVEYADMPKFYNGIDYLLVTSDIEGGCFPIIEALACGVPVISTDVGYVGEVEVMKYSGLPDVLTLLDELYYKERSKIFQFALEKILEQYREIFNVA